MNFRQEYLKHINGSSFSSPTLFSTLWQLSVRVSYRDRRQLLNSDCANVYHTPTARKASCQPGGVTLSKNVPFVVGNPETGKVAVSSSFFRMAKPEPFAAERAVLSARWAVTPAEAARLTKAPLHCLWCSEG